MRSCHAVLPYSVLENGVEGKAVLDAVIDASSQMQNLREVSTGRGMGCE